MLTITSDNLYDEVFNKDIPVVMLFQSRWNDPSQELIERFSKPGVTKNIYKMCCVNADASPELVIRYSVRVVPEFVIVYKHVRRHVMGFVDVDDIMNEVERVIKEAEAV